MSVGVPEFGVVYLAFGAPYLSMALASALSLRATNPAVPFCVLTNVAEHPGHALAFWDPAGGDTWRFLPGNTADNRLIKTEILRYSPFQKTLYLDCDTFVVGDLDRLPVFLDYFDLVMRFVKAPCEVDGERVVLREQVRFREVPHFNSGVIGFRRSPRTEQFFQEWRSRFVAMGIHRDQPALMEACFATGVRLLPLRDSWNQGDFWDMSPALRRDVVIWHYKSRSWDRRIVRLVRRAATWFGADEAARAEVERYIGARLWSQNRGFVAWRLKALAREAFGSLSKVPEHKVGPQRWNELLGDDAERRTPSVESVG